MGRRQKVNQRKGSLAVKKKLQNKAMSKKHSKLRMASKKRKLEEMQKRAANRPETVEEKLARFENATDAVADMLPSRSEADNEFFDAAGGAIYNFVDTQLEGPPTKKRRGRQTKREKIEEENTPKPWEQQARVKDKWLAEAPDKLPIKRMNGEVLYAQPTAAKVAENSEDMEVDSDAADDEGGDTKANEDVVRKPKRELTPLEKAQKYYEEQTLLAAQKDRLAQLAALVMENPEENVMSLKDIRELCEKGPSETIKKYVILSEVAIYKDILPGYLIRLPTEEELKQPATKEVKKLREYESRLLKNYQTFVNYMDKRLKNIPRAHAAKAAPPNTLTAIIVKAIGQLLVALPHFNFRASLIYGLTRMLDASGDHLSRLAEEAARNVFMDKERADVSLTLVRSITSFCKLRKYHVRDPVIGCLSSLPLTEELPEGMDVLRGYTPKKARKHMSRKQKKEMKANREIEKEMKESSAAYEREVQKEIQTDTLKLVFILYFHILRKRMNSRLLPTVLEGLAHFAHLINVALRSAMLTVLRGLVSHDTLPLLSKLHCCRTAFQTMQYQGDTLDIDLKDYYTLFYSLMFDLQHANATDPRVMSTALECLQLMIGDKKQFSLDRVAAFIKRTLALSLYLSTPAAIAAVSIVRSLLKKYPKTQQLLDPDFQGSGVYRPALDDPEHCCAFASTAWEFCLLHNSPHPVLQQLNDIVVVNGPLKADHKPLTLFDFYAPNTNSMEEAGKGISYLYPPPPTPPQHPVDKLIQKNLGKKNKANHVRAWFVQPSYEFPQSPFLQSALATATSLTQSPEEISPSLLDYYEDANDVKMIV
eukprot:TRINITY_DN1058_c0_g1_i1.p1 TRINITY_DN1058_c0_g1~~TRINITY_DN1058_c0_g1_i1.p1  ORF type:complete len:820 (-),score=243.27 TRINITY_DN1058_c0_g1_i1:40-2499(-)